MKHIKKIQKSENWVDGIQKEYSVHRTQKGKPGYKEGNVLIAAKKVKDAVKNLLGQQKQSGGLEKKAASSVFSGRMAYAAGLAAVLAGIAILSGFYIPPPLY